MSSVSLADEVYVDPNFSGFGNGPYRLFKYRGSWMKEIFFPKIDRLETVENMNIRPSDILLVSFPKSGTTWLQEIILQISCTNNSELAARTIRSENRKDMDTLFPWIEDPATDLEELEGRPSPRFIKFHLSYEQLPKGAKEGKCKIIYIARDVRDVAVSYYHFMKSLTAIHYNGTVDDMCKEFLKDTVYSGPWLQHVKGYWERRDQENILFVTYEDLKMNPHKVVERVAEFLEVTLIKAQIDDIVASTSFDKMKKNDAVNFSWLISRGAADPNMEFMRKGIIGDWENHISQELGERMDEKFLQPLRDCGLAFDDSLKMERALLKNNIFKL